MTAAKGNIPYSESGPYTPDLVTLDAAGRLWIGGKPWPDPVAVLRVRVAEQLHRVDRILMFSRQVHAMEGVRV